jgi:hypothetical protein
LEELALNHMHVYATNSEERKNGMLTLAGLSVALAYGFSRTLKWLSLVPPWWLETPSVIGFFGLLYLLFERYIWKVWLLRFLGLIRVPDLGGAWHGEVRSSYEQPPVMREVEVTIHQTWRDIAVKLESGQSCSESVMGAIFVGRDGAATLTYEYTNEPQELAVETLHAHRGTAYLGLKTDGAGEFLEGGYYTGRDRQNVGRIKLRRGSRPKKPVAATAGK